MNRLLFSLCVLSALTFVVPASADEAAARAHFSKGIELYDKKQFQGALTEFEAAYKEKPSAGIKQNVALCLKGLNKPAEAATAFDEALDEGKETLKPETKQAIERELVDLSKVVATVQITILGDEKRAAESVVTIQPAEQPARTLAPGAQRKPLRLMPGIYTFSAKIPGQPPSTPKKLALISGPPTEVTFGVEQAAQSTLDIHVNVPEATIKIDGVEVGKGAWHGPVPASKKLRIEVSATGYRPLAFDMTLPANSTVDSPITLQPTGAAPPEYKAGSLPPAKPRGRWYLAVTGSVEASSYRLSPFASAPTEEGLRRVYPGVSIGGRFGFLANRYLAVEGMAELGLAVNTIKPATGVGPELQSTISHWVLMPAIRFQTPGKVRFMSGMGLGLQGLSLKNEPRDGALGATTEAGGVAFAWLIDAGAQFDVGPIFMEAAVFLNLHGVGSVEEDVSGRRALLASPAFRSGLRVGLGMPF